MTNKKEKLKTILNSMEQKPKQKPKEQKKHEKELIIKKIPKVYDFFGTAAFSTTNVSNGGYQGNYKDQLFSNADGVTAYIRGQKTGRDDHMMIESIEANQPIHILHREKDSQAFTYIGAGTGSIEVVRVAPLGQKTDDVRQMNLFKVTIPSESIINTVCPAPVYDNTRHFKRGALRVIGFDHTSIQTCFYRR